jgi:hypothetical protein
VCKCVLPPDDNPIAGNIYISYQQQASKGIRSSSGLRLTLVAEFLTVGPVTGTLKEEITPIHVPIDPERLYQ